MSDKTGGQRRRMSAEGREGASMRRARQSGFQERRRRVAEGVGQGRSRNWQQGRALDGK